MLSSIDHFSTILKKYLLIGILGTSMVSCRVFKHSATSKPLADTAAVKRKQAPVFIETISIRNNSDLSRSPGIKANTPYALEISSEPIFSAEKMNSLQFKYAILLDVPVEQMIDFKLMELLENWYGTPYRMGGNSKSGIDCSAFVQTFMKSIFDLSVSRTANEQYQQSARISKNELKEGDLVFFRTQRKKRISHVGVYIRNNRFVHASTSSGVMISSLNESYFVTRYAGAGRVAAFVEEGSKN